MKLKRNKLKTMKKFSNIVTTSNNIITTSKTAEGREINNNRTQEKTQSSGKTTNITLNCTLCINTRS